MRRVLKTAALCGIAGPFLFAGALIVLTLAERDFMYGLGWNPLTAVTHDWPSGLALGPIGVVMTAVFIICGLALVIFAFGFWRVFQGARAVRAASALLALAGAAMGLLAFPTDPTDSRELPTLHGRIHDGAFVTLGVTLVASLVAFGFVFRAGRKPGPGAIISWVTAAVIVLGFAVKGIAFYLFLAAFLVWCETASVVLLKRAGPPAI